MEALIQKTVQGASFVKGIKRIDDQYDVSKVVKMVSQANGLYRAVLLNQSNKETDVAAMVGRDLAKVNSSLCKELQTQIEL